MAVKKVLLAVGLACVLTPAALAMMRQDNGFEKFPPQRIAQTIFDFLKDGMKKPEEGESRLPVQAGSGRLPFTSLGKVIHPALFTYRLPQAEDDTGPVAGGPMEISYAAFGEPRGQETAAVRQEGSTAGAFASGGLHGNRGGAGVGAGGAGGGFGGGGSGGGGGPTQLALEVMPEQQNGEVAEPAVDGSVTVMPLPASVWMLLASVLGFGFIGYSRRSRPS